MQEDKQLEPIMGQSSMRSSNIELLRIVAMLAIIAHHYVVNSTVTSLFDPMHPTANSIFLQLLGMWGKTAINVFVLITGYFMCESRLTLKKYSKLLFQLFFYSWVMWCVLIFAGYETFSWIGVVKRLVFWNLLVGQDGGFVPAFMWMYLMIPFMNIYIRAANRRYFLMSIGVLLGLFSVCGTIFHADVYHHVFWYVTVYFVGAAIRKYPFNWFGNNMICMPLCLSAIGCAMISVVGLVWGKSNGMVNLGNVYYMVHDSNRLFAILVAVLMFLTFRNLKIGISRFVNTVASTTFGILLIHAASDGMRKWLWQDFVNVPRAYSFGFWDLIGYSIFVIISIFVCCSMLDYLRIVLIERPIYNRVKHKSSK